MDGKTCAKCGEWKPADQYHKSAKTGLQSRCKVCRSRRTKPLKENVKRYPKYTGRGQGANRVPIVEFADMAGARITGRKCTRCDETKPLTSYWKSSKSFGGYVAICKECQSTKRREIYASKPRIPIEHEILPERPCRTCGVVKPLEAYYYDNRSYDKHAKDCRECYGENLFKGLTINEFEKRPERSSD